MVLDRNHRRLDVRVRLTDDGGATGESGFAVSIQKAACVQQVRSDHRGQGRRRALGAFGARHRLRPWPQA